MASLTTMLSRYSMAGPESRRLCYGLVSRAQGELPAIYLSGRDTSDLESPSCPRSRPCLAICIARCYCSLQGQLLIPTMVQMRLERSSLVDLQARARIVAPGRHVALMMMPWVSFKEVNTFIHAAVTRLLRSGRSPSNDIGRLRRLLKQSRGYTNRNTWHSTTSNSS